jgi:hypothetical protein
MAAEVKILISEGICGLIWTQNHRGGVAFPTLLKHEGKKEGFVMITCEGCLISKVF